MVPRSSLWGSVLAALVLCPSALAAPTDLDTSFGTSGVTITDYAQSGTPRDAHARDVALAPDGKIVVAGPRATSGTTFQWYAARYSADGVLDTSFAGGAGKIAFNETGTNTGATSVAVGSDGAVYFSGETKDSGGQAGIDVDKIDPDGSTSHLWTISAAPGTDLNGSTDTTVRSIAIEPNGQLVVAGDAFIGGTEKVFAARFTTGGVADATFDNDAHADGVYFVPASACDPGAGSSCVEAGLAFGVTAGITSDIYLGGLSEGSAPGGRVFRLHQSSADAGFSVDGTYGDVATPGAAQIPQTAVFDVESIARQSDGRIVAVGGNSANTCGIARLTTDGALDPAFGGGDGTATFARGTFCGLNDVAIDGSGRFVVAGYSDDSALIGRFTAAGSLDDAFVSGGVATSTPGGTSAFFNGLVLQGAKPLAVGGAGTSPQQILLARFQGGDVSSGSGSSGGSAPAPDTTAPAVTIDTPADGQQFSDREPVFAGAAGTAPGDQAGVRLVLTKFDGATFAALPAGHGAATATASGARWSLQWPEALVPGYYRVQASQADDAGNTGQSAAIAFTIAPDAAAEHPELAARFLTNQPTAGFRKVPKVVGLGLPDAQDSLTKALLYDSVDYTFEQGTAKGCSPARIGVVLGQSVAAGTDVLTSIDSPAAIVLTVCFGGTDDLKACDVGPLRKDLRALDKHADGPAYLGAFLGHASRCAKEYDVKIKAAKSPDAEPTVGSTKVIDRPGKRRDEIKSVIDCPRDPAAQDLRIALSEGAAQQAVLSSQKAVDTFGLRRNGTDGWTLPAGWSSYFRVTVFDRAWQPVDAMVYVDPSGAGVQGFSKQTAETDDGGQVTYRVNTGHMGTIDICAVTTAPDGTALYATAQIKVVSLPAGEIWETVTGRRIVIPTVSDHLGGNPVNADLVKKYATKASAAAFSLGDLWNWVSSLWGGSSRSVQAAGAATTSDAQRLRSVYGKASVSPAEVNTCGGVLDSTPSQPVIERGPVFYSVNGTTGTGTAPVVKPPGNGSCGAVVLSLEGVTAGQMANVKSAVGGGIVASGGGNIVASGGGNIVASGAGNIVASGAGNLVP